MSTSLSHSANRVAALLLLLAGFLLPMSVAPVAADEVSARLVWREEAGSVVRGYYLRNDDGDPKIERFQQHGSDWESQISNLVDSEEEIFPDRPDEEIAVISNGMEEPIEGSWVTIYLLHSEHYMVHGESGNVKFVDKLSRDPADLRLERWFIPKPVQADLSLDREIFEFLNGIGSGGEPPGIALCINEACDGGSLKVKIYTGDDNWDWKGLAVYEVPDVIHSGYNGYPIYSFLEPLPEGIGIVPDILGMNGDYAMEMVRRAGFQPERIPTGTHDAKKLGYVNVQGPEPWEPAVPGSDVAVGVVSEVDRVVVPDLRNGSEADVVSQLQGFGFDVQTVYESTDDESKWSKVLSIYYPDYQLNLFEETHAELMDMETEEVVLRKNIYLEVHVGVSADDAGEASLAALGVSFLAPNGTNYVTSSPNSHSVSATATRSRGWEKFIIESNEKDEPITSGSSVRVLASHGLYWSAKEDGALESDAEEVGPAEVFTLLKVGGRPGDAVNYDDRIVLQSSYGKYVSASGKGGGSLKANGPRIGGWEPLTLVQPSLTTMKVALLAGNGVNYFTLSGSKVRATAERVRGWEKFTIKSADGDPIRDGGRVSVKTYADKYFVNKITGKLFASSHSVGDEEMWKVEKLEGSPGNLVSYGDKIVLLGTHGRYIQAVDAGGDSVNVMGEQYKVSRRETLTLIHPR